MKVLLNNSRKRGAQGLTLIELVVVLAILVALVGLVLAFFPGLLSKASKSTSASSIQDVARAVQINYTQSLSYGTGYDSLLDSTGASQFAKLPNAVIAQITPTLFGATDVTALASLGVTSYRYMLNVANDATFAVSSPTLTTISTTVKGALLTDTTVQTAVRGNYTPVGTAAYYVFGLGKGSSIVGTGNILNDAPVRAGSNANENPTTSYQRYGLVFLVDDSGAAGARNARFLGACAFASTGITTAEGNLQQYYSN